MLFKLTVRNCIQGGIRSVFVVVAVVLALTVNGLYLSYANRIAARTKLQPGAPRVLVVVPKVTAEEVSEITGLSPAVIACERIVGKEMLVGSSVVDLWLYPADTSIVRPFIVSGRMPLPGEVAVQQELAESLGVQAGSGVAMCDPVDSQAVLQVDVSGVFSDPLWPALLAPADEFDGSGGSELLLVRLKPETEIIPWQRWFARMGGGSAIPLEEMNWTVGRALRAYADRANEVLRQPASLADQLKFNLAALILILAALGVANGVALSMVEHESQTALLRALGTPASRIALMRLFEAAVLMGLGIAVASGGASLAAWAAPGLVGTAFVQCVLQGSPTVVIVSLCATLGLVAFWHSGSPMALLRRRAS